MSEIAALKTEQDGFQVEFEVISPLSLDKLRDKRQMEIMEKLDSIDKLMEENQRLIDEYNAEIDRLTSQTDALDYTVAVACGVLTSALDVFFVGEFDFESSLEKVNDKIQDIVSKKASMVEEAERDQKIQNAIENAKKKAEEKGEIFDDDKAKEITDNIKKKFDEEHDIETKIQKAIDKEKENGNVVDETKIQEIREKINNSEMSRKIKKLEDAFGIPSDDAWKNQDIGVSAKSHHLDDLAHHPSVIGWAASILTQFTGKSYFQNKEGVNHKIDAIEVKIINNVNAYIQYGTTSTIEVTTKGGKTKKALQVTLIGDDLKTKLACGTFNWIGHLISDLAGSSTSARKGNAGMGLPGPLMSTLKEFAMLPLIKKTKLPELLNDLFTKDNALFGKYRLDMRSELALGIEIGKQAIPVFINEILVRAFFFIRRLITEGKKAKSFEQINWEATKPWKNRTIVRMLTISMGTFEVIDLGDAAIRGAIKSGGTLPGFFAKFVLRVNFVGVGRFAIACGTDAAMGVKKEKVRNKRIKTYTEQIFYSEVKVYYKQADMWISAENAGQAIHEAYKMIEIAETEIMQNKMHNHESMTLISNYAPKIKRQDLKDDICDILNGRQ